MRNEIIATVSPRYWVESRVDHPNRVEAVVGADRTVGVTVTAGGVASGGGMDQATADARYVNITGDTMTGPLVVPPPTAPGHPAALVRVPDPTTGDVGLPGWAGSDTGWRDVSAFLYPGYTVSVSNGTCSVRRLASQVHYRLKLDVATGAGALPLKRIPGFFVPTFEQTQNLAGGFVKAGAGQPLPATPWQYGYWTTNSTGPLTLEAGIALPITLTFRGSHETVDAWPASLPGTQISPPATWT